MTSSTEKKLGELLVQEGIITADQLEKALEKQQLFGTRICSSIAEMGFAAEESLVRMLGEKLGVPFVGRKELYSVPEAIASLLSRDLAFKYHVVPFKLVRNRLSIAMIDPTDLKAIDEIAFITGHVVLPHIALDVHVSRAMAKLYRISSKEIQYDQIAEQRKKNNVSISAEKATISMPGFSEDGKLINVTVPAEFEGFASIGGAAADEDYETPSVLENLARKLAETRSRDEVADLLCGYIALEFNACGLFILRGTVASGWRGVNGGEKVAGFADLSLLLSKPSVLRDVLESRNLSLGALVNTPENRQILDALGVRSEAALLALPLIMVSKVVAVVLVSDEMVALERKLPELQKIMRKAALAFEMLIIKKKILMT